MRQGSLFELLAKPSVGVDLRREERAMETERSTLSVRAEGEGVPHGATVAPTGADVRSAALRPWVRFCVLGSGSAGNASLVQIGWEGCESGEGRRDPAGTLLIDLGFGPATLQRRLGQVGLGLADIGAVCLTHLDWDHFRDVWLTWLAVQKIPLWIYRGHGSIFRARPGAEEFQAHGLVRWFEDQPFRPLEAEGLRVEPIRLPHDEKGTVGFVIQWQGLRVGYATDLGHVPAALLEAMADVDILAIEANYDPEMERTSARPAYVKARVMGGRGHLSNQQAFEAVRAILRKSREGRPHHVVLLHRSRQCNDPRLLRELFGRDPAVARRLVLTSQSRCSPWLEVHSSETRQLSLGV